MNNVIFYNHFGAGDIFESREFVKEWMRKLPGCTYYYAHGKSPKILKDIPELRFTDVTPQMSGMNALTVNPDSLYVNTWIGRDGRYVLPGIGCTVEKLYEMHNEMLITLGLGVLDNLPTDYIPNISYSYYDTDNIVEFLVKHPGRKVLISNGPVQSNQAFNFDFTPAISYIADKYKDIIFILTQAAEIQRDNVFFTNDVIKSQDLDLNEISFLSKFCDTIIGRNSGPHVFSQVKDNWNDSSKATLSFTYTQIAATFVLTPMPMRKYWSDKTDTNSIIEKMGEVIERN